ncbi:MAG: hypothetical protein IJM35_01905 [Bacteroidales bacterium]|nr:hypothetical protein [Bacteroidales bacterium]
MIVGNECFSIYREYGNGGKVLLMKGLDKTKPDYHDILTIACRFACRGQEVKVLSPVHYKDLLYHMVFGDLIGTRCWRKCPDLSIDGLFYEYESYVRPWNKKKVSRMLSNGMGQSSHIIIDNNKGAADRHIKKLVQARLHLRAPLCEVWLFDKGEIHLLYKNNREENSSLRGNAP